MPARNGSNARPCWDREGSWGQQCIAHESLQLRQMHGLKVPDAIILATARCADLTLATRNSRDFPLELGGVVHPYRL